MRSKVRIASDAARWASTSVALLCACAACRGAGNGSGGFAVRDSAGVRIAESTGAAWRAGSAWRLAERPTVDIGRVEGDAHDLFSSISGGAFLPDGDFVIADGSHTLRAYGDHGDFLWSAGGEGEGPGEFSGPVLVALSPEDSLVAYDRRLNRVSVFARDGAFVRSVRAVGPFSFASSFLPLPGGRFILTQGGSSSLVPSPPRPGEFRENDPAVLLGPDGDTLATIGTFPGMDWHITSTSLGPGPFAHFAHFAVRDSSLVVGTADDMSVRTYAVDGRLEEIVRLAGVDLTVTDADVQGWRQAFLDMAPAGEARKAEETRLAGMKIPERRPAYSEVTVDPDGDLWLSGYHFPGFRDGSWYVFSGEGRYLGAVAMPGSFRVLDIGSSSVLGVWTDDLDVEHVRVYAIER